MNKLELAHEYAKVMLTQNITRTDIELAELSFSLAEAMLAENENRQDKSRPEVLTDFEIDWDKIPNWANFFAIDKDGLQYIYGYEPYLSNTCDYWADHKGLVDGHSEEVEIIENYQGDWRESLRKRP